jgi:hypothetical protein
MPGGLQHRFEHDRFESIDVLQAPKAACLGRNEIAAKA